MSTATDQAHQGETQKAERDRDGLFTTFFMAGFECSTFIWKDGERKDYVTLTGHDRHLEEDYRRVEDLGIGVVREAIRWPSVDRGGSRYDWSTLDPVLDAIDACRITPIWDLCHYGFPDGCDPFSDDCLKRFTDYCRAAVEHVMQRTTAQRFFTPINEISFFAGAGTDMGWMYPFAKGRYAEFKRALCRMDIEGVKAIREVDREARMVHVDPIIHHVPPPDRPDLADEAYHKAYDEAYEAWDMLYGRLCPELGGAPDILDIVGVNCYHFSQAEQAMNGERKILGPRDPRRKPLSELLKYAWERYHRPLIIGETSGYQDQRAEWMRMTMEESMKALVSGIDLQGVCLYPCVDIPDWNTGEWAQIGIYDVQDRDSLERCPCDPYIEELRQWERLLHHPEQVEPSQDGAAIRGVQLSEVQRYAKEWAAKTPGSQKVVSTVRQAP
jgi:beta-glucosidase/6-phospho-beta-glucosidase/beta-galactosidase